ncbi:glycosyltransferase [Nocardia acidivorans]|uniref:glycosyltransferase n=1 Tax=Nocardia acidivorans TaxID=404580 RepID=UPI00082E4CBD|nr:glycosyltransferase [Nocardia acidivorans]
MKVLLAFAGSRGDAQPGALLGRELAARGHRVTVAVSPNLVEFAAGYGVSAVPCGVDTGELLRAQQLDRRFASWNPVQRMRALVDLQRRGFAEAARDLRALAGDAEVLVTGMACEELAAEIARSRGIPLAAMHFFPIRPNRSVPVVPAPWGRRVPDAMNRLGWRTLTKVRAWSLAREIAALEGELRDDSRADSGAEFPARTAIQAYDIELFPGLAEELAGAPVTGFPVVPGADADDRTSHIPADAVPRLLAEWLRAGDAPVYAGFGSMPVADPVAVERLVREVCRSQGRRVLLTGSMFPAEISPRAAVLPQVDHRAVLPRCAVAIHHGGAGTTAAALRAGVPSVICSVQADQPFWGRQLETLGLGATLPFAQLTADRLERALIRATEPTVMLRASAYGLRFHDDGVARAADVIESLPSTAERDSATPQANSVSPETAPAAQPSDVATLRIGGTR